MPAEDLDVVVVGAGIVGLAVARELLARRPGLRLAVLDKQDEVGFHQTGHNSGVIHAGIYYPPGSLKARLCVEGARRLYELCERHAIPHERCGKLIVARDASELAGLAALEQRGLANRVPGLRRLRGEEIAEVEPECRGAAALHSPATGIVDFGAVARALAAELRDAGVRFELGCEVTGVRRAGRRTVIEHSRGELAAGRAVLCAGLWADRLAVSAGAPADPRIVPFRGAYLRLKPGAGPEVRGMIYPVPDPELPFLGVHITRHVGGGVLLGPTALLVGARDAYRLRTVRARDVAATLAWPGTWRLMARFWRTGLDELRMAASPAALVQACADYLPALRPEDVEPGGPAGVRAQAVDARGTLIEDFVLSETPGALHIRNAPSPAATSSLALASEIADRLEAADRRN